MDLDAIPLDVLLALQEAMTDPTRAGAERARLRAADAGFHVQCLNPADPEGRIVLAHPPTEPEPMPEAAPDTIGVELRLDAPRNRAQRRAARRRSPAGRR